MSQPCPKVPFQETSLELAFDELCKTLFPQYLPQTQKGKEMLWGFLNQSYGIPAPVKNPDLRLFANAQNAKLAKENNTICGDIQFSPVEVRKRHGKTIMSANLPSG